METSRKHVLLPQLDWWADWELNTTETSQSFRAPFLLFLACRSSWCHQVFCRLGGGGGREEGEGGGSRVPGGGRLSQEVSDDAVDVTSQYRPSVAGESEPGPLVHRVEVAERRMCSVFSIDQREMEV
ncbi:unnamed protein product [Pleuronectes platessa]|uniref:Uncharacterized protein n=1 Tax=Pleuronectes platessa TaxID=8262 RepID=A0A9N7URC9_PLEPL|nr:unnamed protein product [Pleuronectes platessa]